ncbi:hypothetical protein GRW89_20300 [Pseudomonas moraviensis]|uniref:Uncharacterized protein n=1 Tax=Pseudomonas atacamensis TaxID=2565368 RepID=A0ABQ5PE48_9PSED|nr:MULTISPECIES: hypothetical protein [Pseudomonas]MXI48850.1 hypothetical protein [Pseudomonas moraviensis]GLH41771.1 hypothetical protein RS3R1_08580 [Pseudomonas atacamensis]
MSDVLNSISALPNQGSATVMGNNLLSFFSGLTPEDKRFVKDSMRWAEYRADLRHNRNSEPAAWFEYYSGVLWSVGWSLEQAPVIHVDKNFTGNALDVWARSLSQQLSREKVGLMKEAFHMLETHSDAIDVFRGSAREWSDFRFSPAQYNFNRELEIVVSNVRLLDAKWSSTYLFWTIQHTGSELDIRSRRFLIRSAAINENRLQLAAAVLDMRTREIELARGA